MWVFAPIGFFSATLTNPTYKELPQAQQHDHIMVRARVRSDLVRLVELHQHNQVGEEPEILSLKGHDYPYRIVIPHKEWVLLATLLANAIDYSNFKNAVEDQAPTRLEGQARHDLYLRVWSVMNRAETWLAARIGDLKGRLDNDPREDWELFGADLPREVRTPEPRKPRGKRRRG